MEVRCRVCGKKYAEEPEVCEYDGLSDFEEISESTSDLSYLEISSEKIISELSLADLPIDLTNAGITDKISFPFKPAGVAFPINIPFGIIFSENDFKLSDSEKEDAVKISILKNAIKTDIRLKKHNEEFDRAVNTDTNPDSDYHEIDLSPNDTIYLNGLFFKHVRK